MKTGDKARVKQPELKGKIIETRYTEEHECLEHLLEYEGADGETHQRWFLAAELEGVK